jgi:hypothetical protein
MKNEKPLFDFLVDLLVGGGAICLILSASVIALSLCVATTISLILLIEKVLS